MNLPGRPTLVRTAPRPPVLASDSHCSPKLAEGLAGSQWPLQPKTSLAGAGRLAQVGAQTAGMRRAQQLEAAAVQLVPQPPAAVLLSMVFTSSAQA